MEKANSPGLGREQMAWSGAYFLVISSLNVAWAWQIWRRWFFVSLWSRHAPGPYEDFVALVDDTHYRRGMNHEWSTLRGL